MNLFINTENTERYRQYLELRDALRIEHRGIDLATADAADIIEFYVTDSKKDWRHVLAALMQRVETKPLRDALTRKNVLLTFDMKKRADHDELSRMVAERVRDGERVVLTYKYRLKAMLRLPMMMKKTRKIDTTWKNRLYAACRMAAYACMTDDLDREFKDVDLRGKKYVAFCAPAYTECLLTLYFKSKGMKTYGLSHGNFGRYKKRIANDVVNGANIVSDVEIVFGETQKEDLIRDFDIDKSRIEVAGNPKYLKKDIETQRKKTNTCLIIGGIWEYDNDLRKLLPMIDRVAKESGMAVELRPHPLSRITEEDLKPFDNIKMADRKVTIQTALNSGRYDTAITHNTSAYYECLYYGLKTMRWGMNENLDFETLDDGFATETELKELMRKPTDTEQAELLLERVYGVGIDRYTEIIEKA